MRKKRLRAARTEASQTTLPQAFDLAFKNGMLKQNSLNRDRAKTFSRHNRKTSAKLQFAEPLTGIWIQQQMDSSAITA